MLDPVDALVALSQEGTMARAAVRLRITQSAVSKRIDALEAQVGLPLIERAGRRVRLTPEGERMVAELAPLLHQVRTVLHAQASGRPVVVGSSPALLSSWLPAALSNALSSTRVEVPGLQLEIHSYRGPGVVERMRSGQIDLAVVVDAGLPKDVEVERVGSEPMVIVGSSANAPIASCEPQLDPPQKLWLIETSSLTWQAIEPWLVRHHYALEAIGRVESFSTLVQLAKAGFGPALVPRGIAESLGSAFTPFPGLSRPIAIAGRSGVLARPDVAAFRVALRGSISALLR